MEILEVLEVLAAFTKIGAKELREKLEKDSEDGKLNAANVKKVLKEQLAANIKNVEEVNEKKHFRLGAKSVEDIISKKTGIKNGATGEELVTQAFNKIKEDSGEAKPVEITEELLSKDPIAKKWLKDHKEKLNKEFATKLEEKDKLIKATAQKSRKATLYNKAIQFYVSEGANIMVEGEDGARKVDPNKEKIIKTMIDSKSWDFLEDGTIVPVDEKGDQILTEGYKKVSFEDQLKSPEIMPFGYAEAKKDDKRGSGAGKNKPYSKTSVKAKVEEGKKGLEKFGITDRDSYLKYVSNPNNKKEDREEANKAWKDSLLKEEA